MALRYRRVKQITRFLPQICAGNRYVQKFEQVSLLHPLPNAIQKINTKFFEKGCCCCCCLRYSTIKSQVSHESRNEVDLLSFIEHSLNEIQGPNHCWLNKVEGHTDFFNKDGTFLVLAGQFLETSQTVGCDPIIMFENLKLLQRRFPHLHAMVIQSGSSIFSATDQTYILQLIMKEYITFPFLLSNKNFSETENGACYILFKDFKNPIVYNERNLDLGMLIKAIEEVNVQQNESASLVNNYRSTWVKQPDIIKEPQSCSSLLNLLLYFPGCISADESGNRLFLSDSNHHRIIICGGNGKILDCIGSYPGFEDGEFESAKLFRPAASYYDFAEDCLYIVDSENNAIRRADLGTRVLETLYPTCSVSKKNSNLWTWIMNKLGFGRDVDMKSVEFDSLSLSSPWHLVKAVDNTFFVISRSFQTLWIMDSDSGQIKEVVKGFPNIVDICGLILEKVSILKQMPLEWLQQQADVDLYPKELPDARLISSFTTFQNHLIICDMVGQRVLKLNRESGVSANFQLSNFGILGLPYWLSSSLEKVYAFSDGVHGGWTDHLQCFRLLPGRIHIRLSVEIPVGTDLVETLQEGCIWRQARGAAIEVSGAEGVVGALEKVGVAQQWYDELDNLAFLTPESELSVEDDSTTDDVELQDGRVHIDCAVNTSPGTSEVIIYAALYLQLKRDPDLRNGTQEQYATRIAEILNPRSSGGMGRDLCIQFLLKLNRDLRDVIFMKPLNVRIKLDTLNHPKADNNKDIILTDSSIQVNVSLKTQLCNTISQ
ncbi:hypothetical protein CFOL_v3_14182 [Cephalotus follicularis]|uniref:NHL domain-containing protein n=1 Tax=Cephalotus follicularis TaxID=3775 RepID=A0A1Q3BS04_CEPFO|nr:hypothetical protein CFOL_v3_14182 [Cephalotus follicularis]